MATRQQPSNGLSDARKYAWDWFALHANQRMQTLNYFLIAMAFLATAYGTAISRAPEVAAGVAIVGILISVAFNRLDERNRDLVKIGEAALKRLEEGLYEETQWDEVRLVKEADKSRRRFLPSFRWAIGVIELTLAAAFTLALSYALYTIGVSSHECPSPRNAPPQAVCELP